MDVHNPNIKEVFDFLDINHKGYITLTEFIAQLRGHSGSFVSDIHTDKIFQLLQAELGQAGHKIYFTDFHRIFTQVLDKNYYSDIISKSSLCDSGINTSAENTPCDENGKNGISMCEPFGIGYEDKFENSFEEASASLSCPARRPSSLLIPSNSPPVVRRKSTSIADSPTHCRRRLLHLRRHSAVVTSSRRHSMFDPITTGGSLTSPFEDMDRILEGQEVLSHEVEQLKGALEKSETRFYRDREKRKKLMDKIHALEEQLCDMECQYQEDNKRKDGLFESKLQQLQRSKEMDLESYKDSIFRQEVLQRLNSLETENSGSKSELLRLRTECANVQSEKKLLQERLMTADRRYHKLSATLDDCRTSSNAHMEELRSQRDEATQKMEELYQEVQRLRTGTLSKRMSPRSPRRREDASNDTIRCQELSQVVTKLREENRQLREHLADIQTELAAVRVDDALQDPTKGLSLAAEIDQLDKEELRTALEVERDHVQSLKAYMEHLLLKIMNNKHLTDILEIRA